MGGSVSSVSTLRHAHHREMLHQRIEIVVHARGIAGSDGQVSERVDDHAADRLRASAWKMLTTILSMGQLDRRVVEQIQSTAGVVVECSADLLDLVRELRGVLLEVDEQAPLAPAEALDDESNAHRRLSGARGTGEERGAPRPRAASEHGIEAGTPDGTRLNIRVVGGRLDRTDEARVHLQARRRDVEGVDPCRDRSCRGA